MELTVPIAAGESRRTYIAYRDVKGEASSRVIVPLAVHGRLSLDPRSFSVTHIEAKCEKRNAMRTFRVDRIEEIADFETGELMTPTAWASRLHLDDADIARGIRVAEELEARARLRVDAARDLERRWRRARILRKWSIRSALLILALLFYRLFA